MASEHALAAALRIHYPEGDETTASIIDSAIAAATAELRSELAAARRKAEAGERLRRGPVADAIAAAVFLIPKLTTAGDKNPLGIMDLLAGAQAACRRYDEGTQ